MDVHEHFCSVFTIDFEKPFADNGEKRKLKMLLMTKTATNALVIFSISSILSSRQYHDEISVPLHPRPSFFIIENVIFNHNFHCLVFHFACNRNKMIYGHVVLGTVFIMFFCNDSDIETECTFATFFLTSIMEYGAQGHRTDYL